MNIVNENSNNILCYPAILTYESEGKIAVEFPDLNVATSGVNDEDALLCARELLGLTLFGMEEDQEAIPAPSSLHSIVLEDGQATILVDVYMPAVRLAQQNKSVSRTVTIPAWLNAKAQGYNINFSHVLQEALRNAIPT